MKRLRYLFGGLIAAALLVVSVPMAANAGKGRAFQKPDIAPRPLDVVGLTSDGRLIEFRSNQPKNASSIAAIWGLSGDTRLVGIDYRPATGELIGLGDKGGVYTVSDFNAQAVKKSRVGVALEGASFGVDFNPAADRLRIVSDTGQNLRHNVDDGTTTVDRPEHRAAVRWASTGAGLHEQRRRPEHGDDAVRPRLGARPDLDPVAAEQRPARGDRQARRRRRPDRRLRHLQRDARRHDGERRVPSA